MALWPLHWLSWALAASGVVGILLAHDHYTVDIVVAYLFATRLFWTYHTMASSSVNFLAILNFLFAGTLLIFTDFKDAVKIQSLVTSMVVLYFQVS